MKRLLLIVLLSVMVSSGTHAQTADWTFTLTDPTQSAVPGSTSVYDGTITNFTGGDLILDTTNLSFVTAAPASTYTYDFVDGFVNTLGVIPTSGYSGPIFSIQWLPSAPVGATGVGAVDLVAEAPANPSSLNQSFSSTVQPVPEASSYTIMTLGLLLIAVQVVRRKAVRSADH